jgi:hypothetical protein
MALEENWKDLGIDGQKKHTKDRQDNRSPRQDLNNGPLESKEGM